jgi:hypothetical protein
MATPEKLLSVTNAEKHDKLDANKEDAKVQEVGGPEPTWSTANYANFKFDAAVGVSPDSSIPTEVDAEKTDKLQEAEHCSCGKEPCECDSLKEEDGDDDEKKDDEKKDVVAEEGGMDEKPKTADELRQDAPAMKVDEADTDEDLADDTGDETLDLNLADLMDDEDGEMVELSGSEEEVSDEEMPAAEDEKEMPDFTPESDDMVWQDDEDEMKVEVADQDVDAEKKADDEMVAEAEEADAAKEDEKKDDEMVAEAEDEDAKDAEIKDVVTEEDEEEDKASDKKDAEPMAEGKLKISFKMDEAKKLFENNTVLTEEDKRQSRALFESAVRSVAQQVGQQLQEAYQARFNAAKKQHEAKVAGQLDRYMSYVVEQWANDNKVALQNQLRNRLSDSFISGLQKLFVEHYVEVPQSKINVVEALAKNVKSLKTKLKDAEAKSVKLHEESRQAVQRERLALKKEHKSRLIAEAASAVTASDRGAFVERANTVKFAGTKEFKKDLIALREQYFGAKNSVGERPSNEPVAAPLFETKQAGASSVDSYTKIADRLTGRS